MKGLREVVSGSQLCAGYSFCYVISIFKACLWSSSLLQLAATVFSWGFACFAFEHPAEVIRIMIAAALSDFFKPEVVAF